MDASWPIKHAERDSMLIFFMITELWGLAEGTEQQA